MNLEIEKNYQIISVVNRGNYYRMYVAEHNTEHTRWAVKEIKKTDSTPDDYFDKAEMLKKMDDPVLPHIREMYNDEDSFSTVEEYVPGVSLRSYVEQSGIMDEEDVIRWVNSVAGFLHRLHSRPGEPIFGALDPDDLRLMPDNSVRIADYSAVCGLKPVSNIENYGFLAPEQRKKGRVGPWTDIYTLAAVAYFTLTGKDPNEEPYRFYPLRYYNPGASAGIEYILNKCLQQNRHNRYQSAAELLYDLENIHRFDKVLRQYRLKKALRGISAVLVAAAACGLIVFGQLKIVQERKDDYRMLLNNAASYAANGEYELAYARLDEAQKSIPDDVRSYEQRAQYLYDEGEYTKCADYATKQLAMFPDSKALVLSLAMSDYGLDEYRVASEYFRLAGTENMSSEQLQAYIICLLRLGRTGEAGSIYTDYASKWDYAAGYYIQGELYAAEGEYAEAAASLSGALGESKDDATYLDSLLLLADVYARAAETGDTGIENPAEAAEKLLETAASDGRFASDGRLLSAYAKALSASGNDEDVKKAAGSMVKAVEVGETDEDDYLLLCSLLSKSGDHQSSLEYARQAEALYPDSWKIHARAAWEEIVMQSYLNTVDRDYGAAFGEYQQAEILLGNAEGDELMEGLRNKISDLQDAGFIN